MEARPSLPDSSGNENWSAVETRVRSVLSKLVKVPEEKIGRHTSIYRYGLDSIGAVQFATLLRRESSVISAVDVIENPTCAGIASCLASRDPKEQYVYNFNDFQDTISNGLSNNYVPAMTYEAILPCTPTQQGMISQFLSSKGVHYFNYASWTLVAGVDLVQVVEAWSGLIARHQVLRAGFLPVNHKDTSYAMVVHQKARFSLPVSIRQSGSFNSSKWRAKAASDALKTLSTPPWQVIIVEGESNRSMHLAMHHALYDAHSLHMLLQELARAISGRLDGEPTPIQPALSACLNPVYSQSASEAFWRGKTEDLVVNKFPTMTPLHITEHAGLVTSWTCGTSCEILRRLAADASVTVRAALQAAWTRILSAYLGEASVTFGIVLDGRTTKEERNVMFPLVATVPVLARNSDSNAELLEYIMRYNTSLRRHERTPLSKIQRWLGRPDGQLFDTIIAYQTTDVESEESMPWEVLDEAASVEYALALEVVETASKGLDLHLTHDITILPVEQAHILLRQFDAVLVNLLTSPRGHADQLEAHTPDLFSILPATCEQIPSPVELLHQFVEQAAQNLPKKTALEFVEELGNPARLRRWTYQELNEMGNRMANMLRSCNVPPGSIVATCFNKCPEAYFSILGILKAECGFLSLDPSAPASRLEFILGDSSASCLLIEAELSENLGINATVPSYVVREQTLSDFSAIYQAPFQITPSDTCYCLYTSGTTGTPKGCLISHDNTVQAMLAFKELFAGHWDANSRWLQFASFHFDVSVLEQYWSWFVGITVVAAPKDLILSDLTATISTLGITHIDLTPSLARLTHPDEVPSLCRGVFITGGEQLRQEILQVWGPKEVIYNAYGPTEATIGVTMFQRVPTNGRSSNIGNQFPNVGTFVFEPGTEVPVLRGGVGELCVSGRLVGQGYLNRVDLTKERFPTLKRYGERVYRTGDLVRVLHDGSFDFLGRADDQVKLRGQRLEIGEINHAIRTGLPDQLADVATFVTRHLGQDRDLLVSFLAPVASASLPAELQICSSQHFLDLSRIALEACRDSLPGYMVPTYVLCVPFIPLSANNKADIKQLKQLFAELPHDHLRNLTTSSAGARNALNKEEQSIASAVSIVTQVENTEILPSSSIFELGIDSINVARLAMVLQSKGLSLASPSLILRHLQISRLSQALHQESPIAHNKQAFQIKQSIRAHYHRHIGMVCRALEVDKTAVEYIAPCTPLQEGMISRSKVSETQSAYFNQFQIDLDAQVSVGHLKDCWDSTYAECAILRTTFLPTIDGYIQVAIKKHAIPWFEIDPKGKEIDSLISERRDRWIASNQDTLRYPVEIDYFEHHKKRVLLLRLFHAVYDGHSFELLLQKVNAKYHHESPIPAPTFIEVLPYGPLLKHTKSRPFWEQIFKDRAFRPIPALEREFGTSDVSVSRVLHIDGLEARRIALGVTHQTVLQAAWLNTLSRRLRFVPTIGIIFSGRSLVFDGIENVIGPVFNTLPFRVEFVDGMTWASLFQEVQIYNNSVLEYVHTPLRDIQKWCSKGQPLFDTLLTFDREDVIPTTGTGSFWSSVNSIGTPDYPLALEIILTRDKSLKVNAVARRNIATETTINRLLDEFSQTLTAFAISDNDTLIPSNLVTLNGSKTSANGTSTVNSHPLGIERTAGSEFFQIPKAQEVRHEIASLAGFSDEDIIETISIFELGLDSIDIIKLAARLKRLGLPIPVSELMRNPTIRSIVFSHNPMKTNGTNNDGGMTNLKNSAAFLRDCLIQDGKDIQNVSAILPPTPLQDSMVADMLLSRFHRYFNHDVLEISPDADMDRLKSAWETVYANSPILRTVFAEIDNPNSKAAFCQIVREEPLQFNPTANLFDLDEMSIPIGQARDRAVIANGASDLFQLTFATTPKSRYLIISIAHALYDGWSLELLHTDVLTAYEGHYHARSGYESYLPRLLLDGPGEGESFWADYLNGARPTILDPITKSLKGHEPLIHRSELISTLDVQGLKALCRRYRITPQVLAQGCWAPVLASMSKCLGVTFGVVLSGRDTDEARGLLFPTMNTVPLRIVLHGTPDEYFNYLQATMSDIMEFQHLPLREVQKMAKLKGDKLFNTLFLLQNVKDRQSSSGSPILKSVHSSSAVEYPLCVEMEITENSILWRIAGDERYMSLQDANQVLSRIERALHHFAGDHADILEFDQASGKISVCGLEPFELSSNSEDEIKSPSKDSTLPEVDSKFIDSPIIDVLSKLSGVEKHTIDPEHSIYHLGLDSISAIKASSMLRKRGINISVRELLKATSIREVLSRPNGQASQSEYRPTYVPIHLDSVFNDAEMRSLFKSAGVDEAEVETILPALPMQVHMLSVWQNTGGLLFCPQFTYRLSGKTSRETISNASSKLIAETPVLRTHFAATGSIEIPFVQIVTKPKPTNTIQNGLSDHEQGKWTYEEAITPFASIRVESQRLEEARMYLHIHHALYDAVSLPAMMGRFLELCDNPSTSSLNTYQPRWLEFVSNHYSPEVRQQRQKFWTSYLRGTDPIRYPAQDGPAADGQQTRQITELRRNAIEHVSKLKSTSSAHGVSLQAFFFAAYSKALATSQQSNGSREQNADIIFGVYLANRTSFGGLEETPLPTLSIVPLVIKRPLGRSVVDLAVEIQKDLLQIGSFQNASVGLWEIYDWTGIRIESSVNFLTTPRNSPTADTSCNVTMTELVGDPVSTQEGNDMLCNLAQADAAFASRNEARKAFVVSSILFPSMSVSLGIS